MISPHPYWCHLALCPGTVLMGLRGPYMTPRIEPGLAANALIWGSEESNAAPEATQLEMSSAGTHTLILGDLGTNSANAQKLSRPCLRGSQRTRSNLRLPACKAHAQPADHLHSPLRSDFILF